MYAQFTETQNSHALYWGRRYGAAYPYESFDPTCCNVTPLQEAHVSAAAWVKAQAAHACARERISADEQHARLRRWVDVVHAFLIIGLSRAHLLCILHHFVHDDVDLILRAAAPQLKCPPHGTQRPAHG